MTGNTVELKDRELDGASGGRYHVLVLDKEDGNVRHFFFKTAAQEEIKYRLGRKKRVRVLAGAGDNGTGLACITILVERTSPPTAPR